jgi:hypothetical protein
MKKRTINYSIIQQWASGKQNPIAELSLAIQCSTSMSREIIAGKYNNGSAPKKIYRDRACEFFQKNEDELFPIASEMEKAINN